MKKSVALPDAPSAENTAGGNSAANVKQPRLKAKNTETPPTMRQPANGEPVAPTAIDLLKIAKWFELITPEQMEKIVSEETGKSKSRGVSRNFDGLFRAALEGAAHLHFLANSVVTKCQGSDPWVVRPEGEQAQSEMFNQLNKIWECAHGEELLTTEEAYKALNYKDYDRFKKMMHGFGYFHVYENGKIPVKVISVVRILKRKRTKEADNNKHKKNRAKNRLPNDQAGQATGTQEPKIDPETAHRNLLQFLKEVFEEEGIQFDPSLFFELSIGDHLEGK